MDDTTWGYVLSALALLLFTAAILTTKAAARRIPLGPGFMIATVVNVVFASLAVALQFGLRIEPLQWNLQALALFAVAGGFSTYLGRWFFYESVVRFGPAKASIFQISSPLFTALIAWIVLGEGMTVLLAFGMLLSIFGLMLVSYKPGFFTRGPSVAAAQTSLHQRFLQSVFLLGLGSSLAYAIGNVLRGSAVRAWDEPILGALAGATSGLILQLMFRSSNHQSDSTLRLKGLKSADRRGVCLYVLIGICTITAQMCVISAMRYIPLSVATLVTLCTPILVFPLSHLIWRGQDDITAMTLAGAGLTLLGIFIVVTH